ncbi:MAG: acyl--CoA ligase [Candidatus Brocadiaceae bacterium]|nr:acyl--CoA ligase [Candidatus Brocadiaceae bacterium]
MIRFDEIITTISQSSQTKNNVMSDGLLQCSYQQLPSILAHFAVYFSQRSIKPSACIAFECKNNLPAALTLLSLFHRGQSFVLLPQSGHQLKQPGFKAVVPDFCDYSLTVTTENINYQQPEAFLQLQPLTATKLKPQLSDLEANLYARTSGSMGAAKIIVHQQNGVLVNARHYARRYQLSATDRVAIPLPIFHLYALCAGFLPALCQGASICLLDRVNILSYLDMERKFQPNVAFFTPALCEMLLTGRRKSGGYRLVITSGDRIKASLFKDFNHKFGTLINQYGSTEMGGIAASSPDDPFQQRLTTTGKAMPGMQLKVDEDGILHCKPQHGFVACLDSQGKCLNKIAADGWFKTGDLATIDENNQLIILGRADNQVNRSGFLVTLSDIEQKLENIAGVAQAIVLSAEREEQSGRGQQLLAFCLLQRKYDLDAQQIRAACFGLLPKYAIPDHIKIIKQIPVLANGKVDRQTLLQQTESL